MGSHADKSIFSNSALRYLTFLPLVPLPSNYLFLRSIYGLCVLIYTYMHCEYGSYDNETCKAPQACEGPVDSK